MSTIQSPAFIPVRNDAGIKSLSTVERDFIRSCASNPNRILRTDGRRWDQIRPCRLSLVRGDNTASATIQWSSTRVTCTCSGQLLIPNPDRPNEGMVSLSVDLSPAASTAFRLANPVTAASSSSSSGAQQQHQHLKGATPDDSQKLMTNRILRCLERILLQGGAIDTEALCVVPAAWVWKLELNVLVQDAAGGNLLDAAVVSCLAALRHYRKPVVEQHHPSDDNNNNNDDNDNNTAFVVAPTLIPANVKEPIPLPIHHTPLAISFALWQDDATLKSSPAKGSTTAQHLSTENSNSHHIIVALMDPNHREELVASGSLLTIAMNVHGEICLLDYGGGCELQLAQLRQLAHAATQVLQKQLCPLLETSLQQADEQALAERLKVLQRQQHPGAKYKLPPLPASDVDNDTTWINTTTPFRESVDELQVPVGNIEQEQEASQQAQTQAEEAYRRQALDYNLGHVASKVREDNDEKDTTAVVAKQASSLLKAMLQSVQGVEPTTVSKQELSSDVVAMDIDREDETIPKAATSKTQQPVVSEATEAQQQRNPQPKQLAVKPSPAGLDSDEEEEQPTMLQSEFQSVGKPAQKTATATTNNGDDIDDLASAIKKKKKSKKSKK